jgi:PAS domain S-box-containing protein
MILIRQKDNVLFKNLLKAMNDKLRKLRENAEKILNENLKQYDEIPVSDFNRIIHDLKVYQIELELQNEELRLAQKQLEDSRNSYAQLYNYAPAGYVTLSNNGLIIQTNQTFADMVNKDISQILNINFSQFLDVEDKNVFLSRFNAFFKSPAEKSMELRMLKKNGKTFYARVTGRIIFDQQLKTDSTSHQHRLFLIINDISKEKKIENELIESKNSYKQISNELEYILDNLPCLVFYKDKNNNFIRVNRYLADACNMKKEDLVGVNVSQLYDKEVAEKYYQDDLHVINSGMARINIEEQWETKDGIVWLNTSKIPFIDEKGEIVGVIGISIDITDRKSSELELSLKNEALNKLNNEKDKFFSIISHDLKSPFNSIIGLSEMLVDQVKEKDYEGIDKYATIILNSSHRAMNLLMNLMEWSQSQTGRMLFLPEKLDVNTLIFDVLHLLKESANQKSIDLKVDLSKQIFVIGDKAMISAILRNLISNAIKFTREDGSIYISVSQKKKETVISVKDNGVGIPKDIVSKLFRIDDNYTSPGTHQEKGTGLGLILCKEFVDKHDGRISVESVEGEGSEFCFTLKSGS